MEGSYFSGYRVVGFVVFHINSMGQYVPKNIELFDGLNGFVIHFLFFRFGAFPNKIEFFKFFCTLRLL